MKIENRVYLKDLRPISQTEYTRAVEICRKIKGIVKSRSAYLLENSLDPEIFSPGGAWKEDTEIHNIYRFVVTPDYDVINRLRLYTDIFSGYQLAKFSHREHGSTILEPVADDFDQSPVLQSLKPDRDMLKYVQLLDRLPKNIIIETPRILGEIGWETGSGVINHDSYRYQSLINLMHETGILDWLTTISEKREVNILEIGAGWGGLMYHLKKIIPRSNMYLVDLPESLLFSSLYLNITLPEYTHQIYDSGEYPAINDNRAAFHFIPNYLFDNLVKTNIKYDLVVNIASFQEMKEQQIRYYARNIKEILGNSGILFERNLPVNVVSKIKRDYLINCKIILKKFFKYRRNIWWITIGATDIWANTAISSLLPGSFRIKFKVIISVLHDRQRAMALAGKCLRYIMGENNIMKLYRFIISRPGLKQFFTR